MGAPTIKRIILSTFIFLLFSICFSTDVDTSGIKQQKMSNNINDSETVEILQNLYINGHYLDVEQKAREYLNVLEQENRVDTLEQAKVLHLLVNALFKIKKTGIKFETEILT